MTDAELHAEIVQRVGNEKLSYYVEADCLCCAQDLPVSAGTDLTPFQTALVEAWKKGWDMRDRLGDPR